MSIGMSFFVDVKSNGQLRAVIHNGDDAPLKIARVRLQQYERRIYFDCDAGASPQLYYGDEKLDAPVYDYAKLFQTDANAGLLQIGAEQANAAYSGRPDERPWSERHPAVLWAAILAAVGDPRRTGSALHQKHSHLAPSLPHHQLLAFLESRTKAVPRRPCEWRSLLL